MNALKMTPSSQPVRATSKSSVKRNQNYDSYSSQSNNKPNGKRQQQQTYQVQVCRLSSVLSLEHCDDWKIAEQ